MVKGGGEEPAGGRDIGGGDLSSSTTQIGPAEDPGGIVTKQIPNGWEATTTDNGGTMFKDPNNPGGNNVRVENGNPKSSNPGQQKPYVRQTENGKTVDVNGKEVKSSSLESHIPKEEFKFDKPKN